MTKKKSNFLKTIGEFVSENRLAVILGVIIVAFLGLMFWMSESNKIDLTGIDINKEVPASEKTGNISEHFFETTSKTSKVVLIEYGDFQCGSCGTMSPKVKALAEKYGDKISIIFRNFPIEGHTNALSAAAAVEAAGLQGKYWQMHSLVYENQSEWSPASATERTDFYKKYAKSIGLDENKLVEDMKSSKVSQKITFDKTLGKHAKISGTPTFILNGEELSNDIWGDEAAFQKKIEELL